MAFSQIDPQRLYLLFVVGVICVIVAIPVAILIDRIKRTVHIKKAKKQALAQRRPVQQNAVFVRQTDIESNLSRSERELRRHADVLSAKGEIVQAAKILESIRFQRKAIDLLEQNNFIDEACDMLLRLGATVRAAVLYERNGVLDKAAHYYSMADNHAKAAQCLLELSKSNYRFLSAAANACERASDLRGKVKADMQMMKTEQVVKQCLDHGLFDLLIDYLRDPVIARAVIHTLSDEDRERVVNSIALVPRNIQMMVNWLWVFPDAKLCSLVISIIAKEAELARYFWTLAPETLQAHLVQLIKSQVSYISTSVLAAHSDALRMVGAVNESESISNLMVFASHPAEPLTDTEQPRTGEFSVASQEKKVS